MKRGLSFLLLFGLLPVAAQAFQWRMGETTNTLVLHASKHISEEALWAAHSLNIQGQAERDLWLLATADIRIDGETGGDLRAFGNSFVLNGVARQNVFAYANGLQLTTNSVVQGELALFGADVICEGMVASNAWIFARSLTLAGQWGGTVHLHADEIRLAPGTKIAGDVIYSAAKPLVYDSSVTIGGKVIERQGSLPETNAIAPATLRPRLLIQGYLFMAALLVGMPFVGFFPMLAGGAVRKLRATPWRALMAGMVTVLFGPFLMAFAFMTLVGIPLALLLAALYGAVVYLAHIIVALWLGHALLRAPGPQSFARVLSALALGLFILYFLTAIPGFASFLLFPVVILGSGALVLAFLQRPFIPVVMPPPPPPPASTMKPGTPEKPE